MSDFLPFEEIRATLASHRRSQGYGEQELTPQERSEALSSELQQLKKFNSSVSHIASAIATSTSNIHTMISTTESTNKLLDLWIKILSQTGYTAEILNNSSWTGKENDELEKQQKRFDELNRVYNEEKQRRELLKQAELKKKAQAEKRQKEKDELLKRRVYGGVRKPTFSSKVKQRK